MDMTALMPSLDGIAFEQTADGRFVAQNGVPAWCRDVRPDVEWTSPVVIEDIFPFLSVFLPDAVRAWTSEQPVRAQSDLWTETTRADGRDIHLMASAVRVGNARALVILRSDHLFAQSQSLLQRARELRMVHNALMAEIEQKDILVHTIVHDLAAPLHSIMGVLSLLGERSHDEPEAGWIRLGIQAANRQRSLIGEILDVIAAEGEALGQVPVERVDLSDIIDGVVAEREPVARSRALRIEREAPTSRACVSADPTRLVRVLTNLIDNASRHSPPGGVVRISTRHDDGTVTVRVDDEGPGISRDVLPHLFEKFARGRDRSAGTGLGLFFCRITMEKWGGGIGYEPREGGGARFWIRLNALGSNRDSHVQEGGLEHGEAAHAG
jgi:signal transduction histidine kinase